MDQLERWSKGADRWRFFPAPVRSGSEAASSPECCMSDSFYFVKAVHLVFSWLYLSWVVLTGDGKSHQWRCFLPGTPALPASDTKQKKREISTHASTGKEPHAHAPTHRTFPTHQNQWPHSCSQPKAVMETDHVGGSNHLGGPRVKVRWSLGSRPERGATDLRTYTELECELGLDHRSPTGRCHWPGWRKEVELLQSFPWLLCIS